MVFIIITIIVFVVSILICYCTNCACFKILASLKNLLEWKTKIAESTVHWNENENSARICFENNGEELESFAILKQTRPDMLRIPLNDPGNSQQSTAEEQRLAKLEQDAKKAQHYIKKLDEPTKENLLQQISKK